jgi:hypothetical protein
MLLAEDIKRIKENLKSTQKQFDDTLWREMLPRIREEVKKTLGLNFKTRPVFFEDKFPGGLVSFELKGASSLTIFEGHEGAGIYFLNKRVSSLFTPIFLIHEQLHSCLSQNKSKDQIYIEWFEEGFCQWFSIKSYYELTKNIEVIKAFKERSYIYSKVKDEHNFTKRYYEYMKIFSALYLKGGEKLIAKIMMDYFSNKREKVNKHLMKELEIEKLPKGDIDNLLVGFSHAIEPEKLPPVEYIILRESVNNITFEELEKRINAPIELINKSLFELQLKGMIILKQGSVEINWRKKDLLEKGLIKPFWPI